MKKKILFYAALRDITLFNTQMFYVNTKETLEVAGYDVIITNRVSDAYKLDYDGIFIFFYRKGLLPAFVSKLRGKKVFFTGGNDSMSSVAKKKSYWIQVFLFKICRWLADSCLVESTIDLENMKKVCLHKDPKNLHYCPQAIDIKKYDNNLPRNNNFTTICWMGSTENLKRKGVDKALYYFKLLKDNSLHFSDSKFLIMGREGEGTSYLKDVIKKLNLENDVIISGEVSEEEKLEALKTSKYFFQLSTYEGFGLAALEALASRCIVIHSGKGGLKDTIADDGILVDIDHFDYSVEALDKTILTVIDKENPVDFEKTLYRLYSTFDTKVRINNFKKYLGRHLLTNS